MEPTYLRSSATATPAIALLLLLIACSSGPEATPSNTDEPVPNTVILSADQLKGANIVSSKPEFRSLGVLLPLQGTVDVPPQNMVSISAPLGGYLRSTDLLPGMEIQKGQVLAVLEDQRFIQLQQEYLVTKGNLELFRKDHERQLALNASKTASDQALQQASTQLNTAEVTFRSLTEQLRLIGIDPKELSAATISRTVSLRSPIHGWVANVNVNIGRYVQPTDVLFELVDPTDIHLALTVFEKDLPLMRVGQEVHAHPTSRPQEDHEAEVILVGRSLDSDRSAVVHCHFKHMPKNLVPGMAMSAMLESRTDSVWCVPDEAIVRIENGNGLFIDQGEGTYRLLPVRTGASEYGMTELISPSEQTVGSKVVVKGAFTLLSVLKNTEE